MAVTVTHTFVCNVADDAAAAAAGQVLPSHWDAAHTLSGLGTGVLTALGVNVGSAGAFVVNGGALGTPSSGVATNLTGLPVSSGLTGAGTGVLTALGINVGSTGAFVVNGGALGTPSSCTLTNATGTASGLTAGAVTTNANLTGPITSSGNTTSIASQTGTGTKFVVDTSPTLVTPVLGVATGTSLVLSSTLTSGAITPRVDIGAAHIVFQDASGSTSYGNLRIFTANILDWGRGSATATGLNVNNIAADGTNYERGTLDFTTAANILTIGAVAGGTGTVRAVKLVGASFTVAPKLITAASTTTTAGLNLPSGTAPTSPVNGDLWYDGTNLLVRLAGATKTVTVS